MTVGILAKSLSCAISICIGNTIDVLNSIEALKNIPEPDFLGNKKPLSKQETIEEIFKDL